MDQLKRTFGLLWILLAFAALIAVGIMAYVEIINKPATDVWIQWSIFVGITIPVAIGLFLFGLFAFKGEYDRLPTRSSDL